MFSLFGLSHRLPASTHKILRWRLYSDTKRQKTKILARCMEMTKIFPEAAFFIADRLGSFVRRGLSGEPKGGS